MLRLCQGKTSRTDRTWERLRGVECGVVRACVCVCVWGGGQTDAELTSETARTREANDADKSRESP
jgi:hypothetical protein